jgi:hypothetical protein
LDSQRAIRGGTKFFSENLKGRGRLKDGSDDGMLLKWVLNRLYHIGPVEGIVNMNGFWPAPVFRIIIPRKHFCLRQIIMHTRTKAARRIWGSYNGSYECCHFLGHSAVCPYVNGRFWGAYHLHLQGRKAAEHSV